ncbi:MAG: hypothetical protein MRY21_07110 [Simkaniaceae bacterium]|nr:hypothetical protein [Simkaniaceae bacterium]
MKFTHTKALVLSGSIWLSIGIMLLSKGLKLAVGMPMATGPLMDFLVSFSPAVENRALLIVCFGLFIGYVKGRYVLKKTVKQVTDHILTLPLPLDVKRLYKPRFFIIIGAMVVLGQLMRFVPNDIRGLVDIAVGSALINGAMLYYRNAVFLRMGTLER